MSLFLGPIHYIVFEKIHLNERITEKIVEICGCGCDLDSFAPSVEKGELSELIGDSMIHPWLAERVERAEIRQDRVIDKCFSEGVNKEILDAVYLIGKEVGDKIDSNQNLIEAFNRVRFNTLDGMPCDNGLVIIENTQDSIIWEINMELHSPYMEKEGSKEAFLDIRYALVRGLLDNSIFSLERLDKNRYRLYND